ARGSSTSRARRSRSREAPSGSTRSSCASSGTRASPARRRAKISTPEAVPGAVVTPAVCYAPGVRRLRLTARIAVLIVVVLIIGSGASTILTIKRESALLVEQSKDSARRLVATVVASIETAMLQELPDITRGLIRDLKTTSPVKGLTIYRRNGV